jgi:lipoic acid synthetase
MLGLGESDREVEETLGDLIEAGCSILTLGQYLRPSRDHLPVERYVHPEEFDRWRQKALDMGFRAAASGPFVRSSYQAEELWRKAEGGRRKA